MPPYPVFAFRWPVVASRLLGCLCLLGALIAAEWIAFTATAQESPRRVLRRVSPGESTPITYEFTQTAELSDSGGPVYKLAWSPDGAKLASTAGAQIKLWNPTTRTNLAILRGHSDFIWDVAWSPDCTLLASASADGTTRLWDASSHRELASLETGWAMCLAWSPEGDRLAVGTWAGKTQIWNVTTRTLMLEMTIYYSICCAAWSGNGHTLAIGDLIGGITLWDPDTGTMLDQWRVSRAMGRVDTNGMTWSPDSLLLASAHHDGSIWLWHPDTGEALRTLRSEHAHDNCHNCHSNSNTWARGVAFSPDGRLLVSTGDTATVWSTVTWTPMAHLPDTSLPLWSVAWSPSGRWFALGSGTYNRIGSGSVFLWEVSRQL